MLKEFFLRLDVFELLINQLCFSVIRLFLPKSSRILLVLTEKSKMKNCPHWGLNPGILYHHANAVLTEVSQHLTAILNHHGL